MADQDDVQYANQLVDQINALIRENNQLQAELNAAMRNVQVLTSNVGVLESNVHSVMSRLSNRVETTAEDVSFFFNALRELSDQYFIFKNLSTASKNLTMYTDEYYTKFSFYHKLRRIALGYVIGLDQSIISSESLRLEVEKAYLQNTDYWLAYALMAVMLWAENEREAANRAMNRALSMDYYRSCVFFLLINLRYERTDAARDWYLNYLDKVDMTRLGDEFQYLLQAYLHGLFGTDQAFEDLVSHNFTRLMEQAEATSANFANQFVDGTAAYAQTFLHRTEEAFPTLREVSPDHQKLMDLLSSAEKHEILARRYHDLADAPVTLAEEQAQRVEDVLYGLISGYDDDEWRVVKEQKRNEAILEARGDLRAAQDKFNLLYANMDEKKPLSRLMITWAFSEDPTQTNNTVKRFTISLMKDRICKGHEKFAAAYRKTEPERCEIQIDGCSLSCREDEEQLQTAKMEEFFNKNRIKNILSDKQVLICGGVCLAAALILLINLFSFSPVMLTIGVLGGALGGFLLWKRWGDVERMLEEKKRLAIVKLRQALEELGRWRGLYHDADEHLTDIRDALDRY